MKHLFISIGLLLSVSCLADESVCIQHTKAFRIFFPEMRQELQTSLTKKYSAAINGDFSQLEVALFYVDDPVQQHELDLFNKLFFINPANNQPSRFAQMRAERIYKISDEPEAYLVILQRIFGSESSSSLTTHYHVWFLKGQGWYFIIPDVKDVFSKGVKLPQW